MWSAVLFEFSADSTDNVMMTVMDMTSDGDSLELTRMTIHPVRTRLLTQHFYNSALTRDIGL